MRFSKKSDYALRALVALAAGNTKRPVSIRTLADGNDIPYRFLQQIVLDLRDKGWIKTHAGRDGGITLDKPPNAIRMGEIVRHFDGVLAPMGCVSTTHYQSCSQEHSCRFRRILLEIRNHTAHLMDRTTIAMLLTNKPLSHEEVFTQYFADGAGI